MRIRAPRPLSHSITHSPADVNPGEEAGGEEAGGGEAGGGEAGGEEAGGEGESSTNAAAALGRRPLGAAARSLSE
jgi:hypothetical protein